MANFNETARVKVAARSRQHFNLSHKTITTQDFSRLQPVSVKELVPGDHFKMQVGSFVRLAPLPCPTYGKMKLVTRAFFVPYRFIFDAWPDFIDQTPYFRNGYPVQPSCPKVSLSAIFSAFTTSSNGLCDVVTSGEFDWEVNAGGTKVKYRLTHNGKILYNLLISLGYQVFQETEDLEFSLLPLLAYSKIYLDWYTPSQFQTASPLVEYYKNPQLHITSGSDFISLVTSFGFYECVEKDYFASAWVDPITPRWDLNSHYEFNNELVGVDYQWNNLNVSPSYQVQDSEGAYVKAGPAVTSSGNSINILSQYGLDTLKAIDNIVKRNQITGSRYNEILLTRYGVKIPPIVIGRSEYLGYTEQTIQVGEVMSTADTSSSSEVSNLGDYAGRGVGASHGTFTVEADEFGIMLALSCIQVDTGYPYGYKRELVRHLEPTDFFTPEFDTLGTQPIERGEVFSAFKYSLSDLHRKVGTVFGWTPRYAEYKSSFDILSGDFRVAQFSKGMDSYHLFRDLGGYLNQHESSNLPELTPNMTFLSADPTSLLNNYDRIFSVSAGQDHFICVHDVQIDAQRPMELLGDSIVTEGSREVTVPVNGSYL